MNTTKQRIRELERQHGGTGWADPLFCESRPSPEQMAELEENAKRGIRQLIFFAEGDTCWLNVAGTPPWAA